MPRLSRPATRIHSDCRFRSFNASRRSKLVTWPPTQALLFTSTIAAVCARSIFPPCRTAFRVRLIPTRLWMFRRRPEIPCRGNRSAKKVRACPSSPREARYRWSGFRCPPSARHRRNSAPEPCRGASGGFGWLRMMWVRREVATCSRRHRLQGNGLQDLHGTHALGSRSVSADVKLALGGRSGF